MTIAPAAWAESAQRFRNAPPLPDLIEDLEFLRKTGEHPANAARRLGYDPRTLERRLMRAQRKDLAAWVRTDPLGAIA